MPIAPDFQFSQSSLQDYVDCQRRFQLRYLTRQAWPAVEAEPIFDKENFLRQGAIFHRMAQQYILGLPAERVLQANDDPELNIWWGNFIESGLDGLPDARYPEKLLSILLAGEPLIAKYDLIAIKPGQRAVIVDWKTSRKKPPRQWLAERLQTRIYRYLMVRSGASLNGGEPFAPEQVEMRYWFTNFPGEAESFPYDATQFAEDEAFLADLISVIVAQDDAVFPLTPDERRCRFCQYRSLCARGRVPGTMDEAEAYFESDVDDGPILELEF
jgi:CRISPR/Cas system-associated exonuclease Cas4 (RecB family)